MPHSLRFIAVLLAIAMASAPLSLLVQHEQSARRSRQTAIALTGGDPDRGHAAVKRYGCDACHQISSWSGTSGKVGPSLASLAKQAELPGDLPNDPGSIKRWIQHPQEVTPGVGMPDLGVSDADARDIAAYLYSL